MSYIPFPPLSPEIFALDIGGFHLALRWYALAYIAGLVGGWLLIRAALRTPRLWRGAPVMSEAQLESLLTWVIVGVILGGRIGYVLFYQPGFFLDDPMQILRVWEGGMAFHGGFVGVVVAGILFCRRAGVSMLSTVDMLAMVTPMGLIFGRVANFINAELWGRATDVPWAVGFPGEAALCAGQVCGRHPSQLYEAVLEGVLLGALVLWAVWRGGWLARPGRVMGLFVAGYGEARFVVEFFRQPDAQFVSLGNPLGLAWQIGGWGLTQGQVLSVPMVAVGLWFLLRARA